MVNGTQSNRLALTFLNPILFAHARTLLRRDCPVRNHACPPVLLPAASPRITSIRII